MDNDLTDKQLKFIDAYFKNQSIDAVCKDLEISRATYYNYLNDDAVKQEISRVRANILNDTAKYLQNNLIECSKELISIIKSENTPLNTKISAINSVFANSTKLTNQIILLDKLGIISEQKDIIVELLEDN